MATQVSDQPMDQPLEDASGRSPMRTRAQVRRIVKVLVLVDLVVILAAVGIWMLLRDDPDANVVNDGLRGSRPPGGQVWPELAAVEGIEPAFPTRQEIKGSPVVLVATCVDCRSGDVIGGFLGRMSADAVPDGARLVVLTWGGDQARWAKQWNLDADRIDLHAVTPSDAAALATVRRTVGIGPVQGGEESGITFVHDPEGSWRSTFFVGQLSVDDLAHDLKALNGD